MAPVVSRVIAGEDNLAVQDDLSPEARRAEGEMGVRILPAVAFRGARLTLSATGFSLDDGEIEWKINGDLSPGERSGSLVTDSFRKGDSVQARVKIGGRMLFSNTVTLANAPPEIRSVRIVPETIRPGDSLAVEASGTDVDEDAVTFEYDWVKNGLPAGIGSRLEGPLKRNDAISVKITPFDGTAHGNFLILRREVLNYPPEIQGVAEALLSEEGYSCRIDAADGDGDPLTYALKEAPPGMTIGGATGAIRWPVPAGYTGKVPVMVSVSDGHGGEATYAMVVTIREEMPKEPPKDLPK